VTSLSASPSIEAAKRSVGRRTVRLTDAARDGRSLTVDIWYPAVAGAGSLSTYEPIPGVSFAAANAYENAEPEPGSYPLIMLSHGRTGMRFAYAMLSEALAARGAIVVAPDHAGDVMTDWLSGTFVDDRTNEVNRVGDARHVLDVLLGDRAAVDPALARCCTASTPAASLLSDIPTVRTRRSPLPPAYAGSRPMSGSVRWWGCSPTPAR